jgi:uncharacterized protein
MEPPVATSASPRRDASPARHEVETRWDVRIPVRDGLELSANLWLPRPGIDDPGERFGVILEMIPYGKDNWRRNADVARGAWLASRGFALCRLDVRGTGSSPGVAIDEYTVEETHDGYDAVEWLAAQPWCNGNVGMWGISYGGFTAIQVAKLRPPHLRAIAPVYATDDRYLDDVHVRGGCLVASEMSQYAVSQLGMNAMPPDPGFRGSAWREEWRARLEATPPWLLAWLRHQTDGPYWRQGSLAPEYEAIECAVFHIAGWSDSYVDPAFRMQERCTNAPRRALVGNWVHSFPDDAYPGPNLDWLHEVVRFFDRYLKDRTNGWDEEPGLVWFEREYAEPEPFPAAWPGRWRASASFPVEGTDLRDWHLAGGPHPGVGGLNETGAPRPGPATEGTAGERTDVLRHRATVGTRGALSWGAGWHPNGLARDLRPDEALGLTYTSDPLDAPLSIIGVPVAVVDISATMPIATLVARLSDVAPDGTSSHVATGVLNLTHRRSHEHPEPLEPGSIERVEVPMRTTGYRWRPGHRIRLTLLSGYWPVLWPSPLPGEIRVHRGDSSGSVLRLPVLPDSVTDLPVPAFRPAPGAVASVAGDSGDTGGVEDPPTWRIEEDVLAGTVTVRIGEGGTTRLQDGRELYSSEALEMTASDTDPATVRFASDVVYRWREHDATVDIRATATIRSSADALDTTIGLAVSLDGEPFFRRDWRERITRNLV